MIDIGGRELSFECQGSGSPTVIFEAGFRSPGTVRTDDLVQSNVFHTMVLPGIARITRSCTYERLGATAVLDE